VAKTTTSRTRARGRRMKSLLIQTKTQKAVMSFFHLFRPRAHHQI
jgi:hypothetical protein